MSTSPYTHASPHDDAWVYGLVDIPERRGNERLRVVRKEPVSDQQSVRSRSLVDASLKMRGTRLCLGDSSHVGYLNRSNVVSDSLNLNKHVAGVLSWCLSPDRVVTRCSEQVGEDKPHEHRSLSNKRNRNA